MGGGKGDGLGVEEEDEWEVVKEIGRRRKVLRRRINEIR